MSKLFGHKRKERQLEWLNEGASGTFRNPQDDLNPTAEPPAAGWSYLALQAAGDRCLSGGPSAARLALPDDSRSPWT